MDNLAPVLPGIGAGHGVDQMIPTVSPGELRVAAYTGFEPFIFYRDGQLVGCDLEVLEGFCEGERLELVVEPVERFDGLWLSPLSGEVDLATAGMARFVEREHADIAWTEPYFEVARSILIREERRDELRGIADFSGATIGFVAGSTADLDARARAPAGTVFQAIDSQRHGVELLLDGAIDGLAMGTPSNRFNAHGAAGFAVIDVHEFSQSEGLRFALLAARTELLNRLNHYLRSPVGSSLFEECLSRWLAEAGEAGIL